jgi:pyruvate dehydrogenase E2 component (dihydrolipoamide acetyltransferase)
MPEKVLMLALSPTMEAGTIARWTKNEGDTISSGDIMCEVETDKAVMEYEAIQEGTLLKILVPEGGLAEVGQTIGVLGETGEEIDAIVEEAAAEAAAKQPDETGATTVTTVIDQADDSPLAELEGDDSDGVTKSSPLARKMAERAGIRVSSIKGTGPGGRIIKRDVEAAASGGQTSRATAGKAGRAALSVTDGVLADQIIPVSAKRKIIAQRLGESKYAAPHFYLKMAVFTESMMKARKNLNSSLSYKVSVNAFLMKFVAEAMKRHPNINSTWEGDTIRQFGSIDIGLAVAQDDGLVTPIVRDCGRKGIIEIDAELSALIERARENKLTPEDYTGATFSISSLGTYGVDEFTAIINPPGSAILTVGQMKKVPVVSENDEITIRTQINLTLSCDHRVIDGAKGAEYLRELKSTIEDPVRVLY